MLLSRLRDATIRGRVRRGASHDAGRSPLGAPPWRFSAGAALPSPASFCLRMPCSELPRSQVVVPGGRCPGPPEPAVTSRGHRTPLPLHLQDRLEKTALHERGWQIIYYKTRLRRQDKSHKVADISARFRPCAGGRPVHLQLTTGSRRCRNRCAPRCGGRSGISTPAPSKGGCSSLTRRRKTARPPAPRRYGPAMLPAIKHQKVALERRDVGEFEHAGRDPWRAPSQHSRSGLTFGRPALEVAP